MKHASCPQAIQLMRRAIGQTSDHWTLATLYSDLAKQQKDSGQLDDSFQVHIQLGQSKRDFVYAAKFPFCSHAPNLKNKNNYLPFSNKIISSLREACGTYNNNVLFQTQVHMYI